jgi:hypothetical protein
MRPTIALLAALGLSGCADLSFPTTRNQLHHSTDGPFSFILTPLFMPMTVLADLTVAGITDQDREVARAMSNMQSGTPSAQAFKEAHDEFHTITTSKFRELSASCGAANFGPGEGQALHATLNIAMPFTPYGPIDDVKSGISTADDALVDKETPDNFELFERIRVHLACIEGKLE